MADQPTPRLKLRNQTLASNVNTWGDPYLNNNYTAIDYAFSALPFAIGSATSTTLTVTNYGTANQTQPIAIVASGTGTQTCTLVMPLQSYYKKLVNQASGAVHLVGASGTGVTVPSGATYDIVADGTNWSNATPPLNKFPVPTGAMDFNSQLLNSVTAGTATTQGATLANRLDQFQAPTTNVAFGTQRITNLATPSASSDAATKGYVDTIITTQAGVPLGTGVGQIFTYSTAAGVGWSNAGTSSGQVANYTGSSVDWSNAPSVTNSLYGFQNSTSGFASPAALNVGVTTAVTTWSQPQVARVGTFAWASNNLLNFGTAQYWYSSATAGGTIGRATNLTAGMSGIIEILYSTSGTTTVAVDNSFWKAAGTSTFSTVKSPGSRDVIGWVAQFNGTAVTYSANYGVGP